MRFINCQFNGCSGHHIGEKDVPACGVDTSNSTAIGTTFAVYFVVFDSAGLNATAQVGVHTRLSHFMLRNPSLL